VEEVKRKCQEDGNENHLEKLFAKRGEKYTLVLLEGERPLGAFFFVPLPITGGLEGKETQQTFSQQPPLRGKKRNKDLEQRGMEP